MDIPHFSTGKALVHWLKKTPTACMEDIAPYEALLAEDRNNLLAVAVQLGRLPPHWEEHFFCDAALVVEYAKHILKGPFPAAEPFLVFDEYYSFLYMRDVVKGRCPAHEQALLRLSQRKHGVSKKHLAEHIVSAALIAKEPLVLLEPLLVECGVVNEVVKYVEATQQPCTLWEDTFAKKPQRALRYISCLRTLPPTPERETSLLLSAALGQAPKASEWFQDHGLDYHTLWPLWDGLQLDVDARRQLLRSLIEDPRAKAVRSTDASIESPWQEAG